MRERERERKGGREGERERENRAQRVQNGGETSNADYWCLELTSVGEICDDASERWLRTWSSRVGIASRGNLQVITGRWTGVRCVGQRLLHQTRQVRQLPLHVLYPYPREAIERVSNDCLDIGGSDSAGALFYRSGERLGSKETTLATKVLSEMLIVYTNEEMENLDLSRTWRVFRESVP